MKKCDMRKTGTSTKTSHNGLGTFLTRIFRIIPDECNSTSRLQISNKTLLESLLTYDEIQKIKLQLLEIEKQRAEAIRVVRERYRCI